MLKLLLFLNKKQVYAKWNHKIQIDNFFFRKKGFFIITTTTKKLIDYKNVKRVCPATELQQQLMMPGDSHRSTSYLTWQCSNFYFFSSFTSSSFFPVILICLHFLRKKSSSKNSHHNSATLPTTTSFKELVSRCMYEYVHITVLMYSSYYYFYRIIINHFIFTLLSI